ncbi:hypothetical protein D7231_12230 [Streptomyces klenkii]|uniref:Berberine/berberine-like domain-containing protein n=1 Tax=Streptomyces klenkii TaxID=1420899 RepID=A0A3B0BQT0_9ACTN|nr:hypothetical protein D7231_12230 [Streptomyces klenkii]
MNNVGTDLGVATGPDPAFPRLYYKGNSARPQEAKKHWDPTKHFRHTRSNRGRNGAAPGGVGCWRGSPDSPRVPRSGPDGLQPPIRHRPGLGFSRRRSRIRTRTRSLSRTRSGSPRRSHIRSPSPIPRPRLYPHPHPRPDLQASSSSARTHPSRAAAPASASPRTTGRQGG